MVEMADPVCDRLKNLRNGLLRLHKSLLDSEKAVYERRLRDVSSAASLAAQERLLGYIHPGDQLYIVKNIPEWRRRQNASRRAHASR